jgi:hypothetical protein
MKKLLIASFIVLFLFAAAIYILLPRTYLVRVSLPYKGKTNVANRVMGANPMWQLAMGKEAMATDSGILFHGRHFHVANASMDQIAVGIQLSDAYVTSALLAAQSANDSLLLIWETPMYTGSGPIDRVRLWSERHKLEADMMRILYNLRGLMERPADLYGFDMVTGTMTDSVLLTTSFETAVAPTMAGIYTRIDVLKAYAASANAAPTNAPMLYVRKPQNGFPYLVQVGLPVNKWLTDQDNIKIKRMVLGNNLSTTVVGPPAVINQAFEAMRNYINDHSLAMPAIPYELMLNNRLTTDSSQWQTRIVFPIY